MKGERFLDTNILVYAFADDGARSRVAMELLIEGGVIGVQVLNEFTTVMRRKLRWPWPRIDEALSIIEPLTGPALALTRDIHAHALQLAREHQLAFYDALIVSAANEASCTLLLTEDLQHGGKIGGVTIHNPFSRHP